MDVSRLLNDPCPTYASVVDEALPGGSDAFINLADHSVKGLKCQIGKKYANKNLLE